jgi:hypothetical protein
VIGFLRSTSLVEFPHLVTAFRQCTKSLRDSGEVGLV